MSILIDQNKNFEGQFGPVFRSSAIFFIPEDVNTTITVSNYWDFKNGLEVGLLFSIRDLDGNLIERREKYFDECLVINENDWPISEGSVEVEVFGNKNLRIPYAAVMGIYETQTSITMVHSYGRNHNLIELEDGNFLTVVENMQTGKAEKENPENWDARNDERFLELYGPIGSTSYRFDRWMDSKMRPVEN